jgi:hypothetical protein
VSCRDDPDPLAKRPRRRRWTAGAAVPIVTSGGLPAAPEANKGEGVRFRIAAAIAAIGLFAVGPTVGIAQEADSNDTQRIDEIRDMAIAIGNSYACIDDADAKGAFRDHAHTLFDLMLKDVGSNTAFLFAVSLGYGSAVPQDQLDCPKLLAQWDGMKSAFALVDPAP